MVKRKKQKLSKEERKRKRIERKFKTDINTLFKNSFFIQIATRGEHFEFKGRRGEIDSIFLHENIFIISEDTTTRQQRDIRDHLNNKAAFFSFINDNFIEFITFLKKKIDKFREIMDLKYNPGDYKLIFMYFSLHPLDDEYQNRYPNIKFMEYPHLLYFLHLSKIIKKTARFELFKFLELNLSDVGIQSSGNQWCEYEGLLLPESPSGFPPGYKIVTFLIEPSRLLTQSYVLRTDGWRDKDCLYQRLLVKNKIKEMRIYLTDQKRVFVNNVIVTLPSETRLLNEDGNQIDMSTIDRMQNVKIKLPLELNTIGIIDGQHRIFAYHEGLDNYDQSIKILRDKQHLLVTGIIYPTNLTEYQKNRFEAKLFLEINDKQKRASPALKQDIETIIKPFSSIAISKSILNKLSKNGPLAHYLEEHFFDAGKIKTSSIVSYGMRHIVKDSGDDSLFKLWNHSRKRELKNKMDVTLLQDYIEFCTQEINKLLIGFKMNIPNDMWTLDKKKSRVLTTTTLNGLVFCLRKIIEEEKIGSSDYYTEKLQNIEIDFSPENFSFRSSHWKDLGELIYKQCFL